MPITIECVKQRASSQKSVTLKAKFVRPPVFKSRARKPVRLIGDCAFSFGDVGDRLQLRDVNIKIELAKLGNNRILVLSQIETNNIGHFLPMTLAESWAAEN